MECATLYCTSFIWMISLYVMHIKVEHYRHWIFFSDKPTIIEQASTTVNESDRVILSRLIDSNPLSNVSWYKGSEYLITEFSVNITTFIIKKALCTDTNNFTLVASNLVANNTALVELIVNCKYIICIFLMHKLSDQKHLMSKFV